jgi:hypothetical protein
MAKVKTLMIDGYPINLYEWCTKYGIKPDKPFAEDIVRAYALQEHRRWLKVLGNLKGMAYSCYLLEGTKHALPSKLMWDELYYWRKSHPYDPMRLTANTNCPNDPSITCRAKVSRGPDAVCSQCIATGHYRSDK